MPNIFDFNDILEHVLKYLANDVNTLMALRVVCKALRWKYTQHLQNPHISQILLTTKRLLTRTFTDACIL